MTFCEPKQFVSQKNIDSQLFPKWNGAELLTSHHVLWCIKASCSKISKTTIHQNWEQEMTLIDFKVAQLQSRLHFCCYSKKRLSFENFLGELILHTFGSSDNFYPPKLKLKFHKPCLSQQRTWRWSNHIVFVLSLLIIRCTNRCTDRQKRLNSTTQSWSSCFLFSTEVFKKEVMPHPALLVQFPDSNCQSPVTNNQYA